jgi:hypothetical protein
VTAKPLSGAIASSFVPSSSGGEEELAEEKKAGSRRERRGEWHPGNKRARFFTAAGSANESLAALRVAGAWGYFSPHEAQAAEVLLRRIRAMLWKLTR